MAFGFQKHYHADSIRSISDSFKSRLELSLVAYDSGVLSGHVILSFLSEKRLGISFVLAQCHVHTSCYCAAVSSKETRSGAQSNCVGLTRHCSGTTDSIIGYLGN